MIMENTSLNRARAIARPTREAMLQRAPNVSQFWSENRDLFQDAWSEWDRSDTTHPLVLDA